MSDVDYANLNQSQTAKHLDKVEAKDRAEAAEMALAAIKLLLTYNMALTTENVPFFCFRLGMVASTIGHYEDEWGELKTGQTKETLKVV